MKRGLLVILAIIIHHVVLGNDDGECAFFKYCDRSAQCQGFQNFSEFVLVPCMHNLTAISRYINYERKGLIRFELLPHDGNTILDETLDMRHLHEIGYVVSHKHGKTVDLHVYNIKGFDIYTDFQLKQSIDFKFETFEIAFSNFDFYSSGAKVDCDREEISQLMNTLTDKLCDRIYFRNVIFQAALCPQVFRGVTTDSMTFTSYYPTFRPVSMNNSLKINVRSLLFVTIKTIRFVLDSSVLDIHMFERTRYLEILSCSLHQIKPPELFKDYPNIKKISIDIYNLKGFLHNMNGLDWVKYLTHHFFKHHDFIHRVYIGVNLTDEERQLVEESTRQINLYNFVWNEKVSLSLFNLYFPSFYYGFPDTDFCLYANYPFQYLVVTLLAHYTLDSNVTCSMAFLYKFVVYFYLPNQVELEQKYIIDETIFSQVYEACDMTQRLNNCYIVSQTSVNEYHDPYFDSYDAKVAIDKVKAILLDIIGPLVSAVGLVANLLIIATIIHNKLKYKNKHVAAIKSKTDTKGQKRIVLLDEPMYKYMLINGILNAAYCLIFLVNLSVQCSAPIVNDRKIASFKKYKELNCLIKDCIVLFTASVLKLTSNIMIIQISFNRYLLLGKNHAQFLINLSEIKVKKVVIASLLISFLFSIVIVFQELFFIHTKVISFFGYLDVDTYDQQANMTKHLVAYNYYGIYKEYIYQGKLIFNTLLDKLSQLPTLLAFTIIHDMVAYFLFCLFSLVMDISTLKMLKETLNEHSRISQKTKEDKMSQNAEKRAFWMILSLNLANFILRLPDLLSSVFFIYTSQRPSLFVVLCLTFNRCLTLADFSNISYILSLALSFFFYLVFNKKFQESFLEIFNKITRRKTISEPRNQLKTEPNVSTLAADKKDQKDQH